MSLEVDKITNDSISTSSSSLTSPKAPCASRSLAQKQESLGIMDEHIDDESIHFTRESLGIPDKDAIFQEIELKKAEGILVQEISYNNLGVPDLISYFSDVAQLNLIYTKTISYLQNGLVDFVTSTRLLDSTSDTRTLSYDINSKLLRVFYS